MKDFRICTAGIEGDNSHESATITIDGTADIVVRHVMPYKKIQIEDVWKMEAQTLFDALIKTIPGGMFEEFEKVIKKYRLEQTEKYKENK